MKKILPVFEKEVPDYSADLEKPLNGLRIGLPKEYFDNSDGGMNAEVEALTKAALEQYKINGRRIN